LVIKMFQNDCFANESGWFRKKRMKKEWKPEKWCQKGFPDLGWARSGDQPNLPFWTAALISTKKSIFGIFQFGPWFWRSSKKEWNWPRPNLQ
jgi:hypothetical protein